MDDSLNPFAREATKETIVAKRDRLLALRADLVEKRAILLAELRRADRDLADCKAAARLFDLDIAFPEEDERPGTQVREYNLAADREYRRLREVRNMAAHAVSAAPVRVYGGGEARPLAPPVEGSPAKSEGVVAPPPPPPAPARPPIRQLVLKYLENAPVGAKAAEMRDFIERTYGDTIHEKTVGMTLFRLSKDNLVHREGHTWFFGAAHAETENPGVAAPGSDNLFA